MPPINRGMPQRGGAVRTLHGLYPDAASLEADMDFYTISCHGETVGDQTFFMVPPDTYFFFTTHSGDYAYATGEAVDEAIRRGDRTAYYQMLYDRFFTEGGSKFSPDLYVYEPGDLLPDYALIFRNNTSFFSQFGVYALPMKPSVIGTQTEYLGRPVAYIKSLLDAGVLKEKDIAGLTGQVAEDLRTKTVAEIQKTVYMDLREQLLRPMQESQHAHLERVQALDGAGKTDKTPADRHPIAYEDMALFDKLEHICCRGNSDNLIRHLLKPSKDYQLRLMNLIRKPELASSKKRFFFMHFCRVSIADIAMEYTKTPQPRLLRALSFSAKCSATRKREEALNINDLTNDICKLEPAQKTALMQTVAGRRLITILKRLALVNWSECLPPMTYAAVENDSRLDLISDYVGYLTMPEVLELADLQKELDAFPVIKHRLASLATELEKVTAKLKTLAAQKIKLIKDVYDILFKITGFGITKANKIDDFLNLRYAPIPDIEELHIVLKKDSESEGHPFLGTFKKLDDDEDNEEKNKDQKDDIKLSLGMYIGKPLESLWVEPIEIPVIKDESVEFGHIYPAEGGGRKRRRRTRHKRKTASIKLNPLTRRLLRNRLRKDKR